MIIHLVEVVAALQIAQWVDQAVYWDSTAVTFDSTTTDFHGRAGVYTRTLEADVLGLEGVEEDDVALTAVASAALVDTTRGSWCFDPSTKVVRIHTTDDGAAAAKTLCVLVLEPLVLGAGLVKSRNGVPLAWASRVVALPSIGQTRDTSQPGGLSAATYGELVLRNDDGLYDQRIGRRIYAGREYRVLRGDHEADYATFELRDRALLGEPRFTLDQFILPARSLANLLDTVVCPTSYTTTAYPGMDPAITRTNIPKTIGPVTRVPADRIASGRWKVSELPMTAITAAVKGSDGTAVTITGTFLSLGEFTVDAAHDSESVLLVTGTGVDVSLIGDTIGTLLEDRGIDAERVDAVALARLNVDRPAHVGFQVREGYYRDVIDGLAKNAFVDVRVTRPGVFTAAARRADQGNLIPAAPTWKVRNATLDLSPPQMFGTKPCIRIDKAAADANAHAYLSNLPLKAGKAYTFTLVAAVLAGTPTSFQLSTTDSDGNEYLTDPIALGAGQFERVTGRTQPLLADVVFFDSTAVTFDSTTYTFAAEGGELRIYPDRGGASDVAVLIAVPELVDTVPAAESNAVPSGGGLRGPVLWQVRAPYGYDGQTQGRRVKSKELAAVRRVHRLASTSELPAPAFAGGLVAEADGAVAAQAAFDYFSTPRMGYELALLDTGALVDIDTVLDVSLERRPTTPAQSPLYRVTEYVEQDTGAGAEIAVKAEVQYEPTSDLTTITAT